MSVRYNSTRNNEISLTSSQCVLKGLSGDGGLFVTKATDEIRFDPTSFAGKEYREIAAEILGSFFTDFSRAQIEECVGGAYNADNFETPDIFMLHKCSNFAVLELFRGKTLAFKDAALSILPHLMKCAKENAGERRKIAILTATSGDTGKAALEGFKDIEGIDAITFYPYQGVSKLQLLQMLTQQGGNVFSAAIHGNFDDAQTAVKEIFNDEQFNEELNALGIVLSSANSINIGRLFPQVVYYYYAYAKLLESGGIKADDKINFAVPTGNFGNILAGYYAMKTGLPINKLICASNENNVLSDFFDSGIYDKNRKFVRTISPSMDILISSNLERLIYEIESRSDELCAKKMNELASSGVYAIDKNSPVMKFFSGGYATEAEIKNAIADMWQKENYLIDPHTACAYKVYQDYVRQTGDDTYTVILSTASPFKFSRDVYGSIYGQTDLSEIQCLYALSEKAGLALPEAIDGIERRPQKAESVISKDHMRTLIKQLLMR